MTKGLGPFYGSQCLIMILLRCMGTPPSFSIIFTKGNNFCDFLFVPLADLALPNWEFSLKGKNFLKEEQILSF